MFLFEYSSGATSLHPFLITFPGSLPLLSLDLEFKATHYLTHRVRRQFGLDQGILITPSFLGTITSVFHTFLFNIAALLPALKVYRYLVGLGFTMRASIHIGRTLFLLSKNSPIYLRADMEDIN